MQMPEFMKTIIIKRINTIAFLKNTKPQLLYQQEVPEKQVNNFKENNEAVKNSYLPNRIVILR